MSGKSLALLFTIFFSLSFSASAENKTNPYLNERFVVNALRQVQTAQLAYRQTAGAGNFGTFAQLRAANLIDAPLASLQKYGYSFLVSVSGASEATSSTYAVAAVPQRYFKTGRRSFYIDETCQIRGADKRGAAANINDPLIETCTPSVLTENERDTIAALRTINSAQATYQSTTGAGNYGSMSQLLNAGLIGPSLGFNFHRGYFRTLTVLFPSAGNPATYKVQTRPETYRRTGTRSFFIDQTGVVRGADIGGGYAAGNEPPIDEE